MWFILQIIIKINVICYLSIIFGYYRYRIFRESEPSKHLVWALNHLGILGVKFGQYLYSRTDIITEEVRLVLQPLLLFAKTVPYESLDLPTESHITNISTEPIAAGSIGQVHRCLYHGKPHIIKFIHPNIPSILRSDIFLFRWLIRIISKIIPEIKILHWENFFELIELQIDMRNEFHNLDKGYNHFKRCPEVKVPQPITATEYYLVMTEAMGVPFCKFIQTAKRDEIFRVRMLIFSTYLKMIFRDQFCHFDLHEGNIIVESSNKIHIIDWGICSPIGNQQRQGTLHFYNACADRKQDDVLGFLKCILYQTNIQGDKVTESDYQSFSKLVLNLIETSDLKSFTPNQQFINCCKLIYENQYLLSAKECSFLLQFTLFLDNNSHSTLPDDNVFIQSIEFMKKSHYWASNLGYYIKHIESSVTKYYLDGS